MNLTLVEETTERHAREALREILGDDFEKANVYINSLIEIYYLSGVRDGEENMKTKLFDCLGVR